MSKIKGITVTLFNRVEVGKDPIGEPVYEDVSIEVDNVLVSPSSSDDIVSNHELYGKRAIYTLGIPKDDTNNWADAKVEFFGETWRTIGIPLKGIDKLMPLAWNKKVMVERYE